MSKIIFLFYVHLIIQALLLSGAVKRNISEAFLDGYTLINAIMIVIFAGKMNDRDVNDKKKTAIVILCILSVTMSLFLLIFSLKKIPALF